MHAVARQLLLASRNSSVFPIDNTSIVHTEWTYENSEHNNCGIIIF